MIEKVSHRETITQPAVEQLLSTAYQERRVGEFRTLVARRAKQEQTIRDKFLELQAETLQDCDRRREDLSTRYQTQKDQLDTGYARATSALKQRIEKAQQKTEAEYANTLAVAKRERKQAGKAAQDTRDNDCWEIEAVYEAKKEEPPLKLAATRRALQQRWQQVEAFEKQSETILARRRLWPPAASEPLPSESVQAESSAPSAVSDETDPQSRFNQAVENIGAALAEFENQRLGEALVGSRPLVMVLGVWLITTVPCGFLFAWQGWMWLAAPAAVTAVIAGVGTFLLYPRARGQSLASFHQIMKLKNVAEQARDDSLRQAEQRQREASEALSERRRTDIEQIEGAWETAVDNLETQLNERLRDARKVYDRRLDEILSTEKNESAALETDYTQRTEENSSRFKQESQELESRFAERKAEIAQERDRRWDALRREWKDGVAAFAGDLRRMNAAVEDLFPPWDVADWENRPWPAEAPPALCLGAVEVAIDKLPGGLPQEPSLAVDTSRFSLPFTLSFSECPNLLLEVKSKGRSVAALIMRNVMLRYLVSLPPGKVRFTIIDPVGLGDNFSAFMHLEDFDPRLIASRIWTEPAHIQQRLVDLTEHMEKVIQKYLRNEYSSIQEYNRQAREVAEPYHILVISDFPSNFNEESLRRLSSIVESGPRCGVHTIISVDSKLTANKPSTPAGLDLAHLRTHAAPLRWSEDRFRWLNERLGEFPLRLDQPPSERLLTQLIRRSGAAAIDAGRVEVPFESVLPTESEWWSSNSTEEIEVPVGKAGATQLHRMKLGRGTSQHVLISGKTGSGKSTLLHVLITSLSAWYGPDQLEFYLIDFKKGVEFKAYARGLLPHARVVAIETEREFGLSALERLDRELKVRGQLFRASGVNDLSSFRRAAPKHVMPRVLLVIDEFQEFFVEEDRIAQQAALLLDRLVRQGRAFGVHVLLGSQTLAGAFSLARSTIGQMAVRIALQCSEADAHLILSEENTAARHLNRPGEAIYNDTNGLLKGNHPFQVAWLSDHQRDACLERVAKLADQRQITAEPAIVFEGNSPADPAENHQLAAALSGDTPGSAAGGSQTWLGSPIAIKAPTSVVFHRHAGSHLLVVGSSPKAALGVLANAMIGLGAAPEASGGKPRFVVFDGARPDAAEAGAWRRLQKRLPLDIEVVTPADAGVTLARIGDEVARRLKEGDQGAAPLFVIVYHLARFRDLRPADDDFGFSLSSEKNAATPAKQFAEVLREGSAVGVHCLVWLDSYNNVSRWLPRQTLREFEMRVLFQMSPSDSTNLIDSPLAGQMGEHRGLLYLDDSGTHEVFRPYRPPDNTWLEQVAEQLGQQAPGGA